MNTTIEWAFRFDHNSLTWMIQRSDGAGGLCAVEALELRDIPSANSRRDGFLICTAELLLDGATRIQPDGSLVRGKKAILRGRIIPTDRILHMPVISAQAIGKMV